MDLINSRYALDIILCVGCDYASIEEATVALLEEINRQATTVNPDALIEYRQFYTSPVPQQYATMFRSIDCPNDV